MPTLTVNVTDKFHEQLLALTAEMGCTLEQFHLLALQSFHAEERADADALKEGLADIDAGRVVPHEAVVAWLDSLTTDAPLPRPVGAGFEERRAS